MNVTPDLSTVLGVIGAIAFLGILVAAIVIGERCPKCKAKTKEVSRKDPLSWKGVRVTRVPRIVRATYRCPACHHEFERRHLDA